MSAILHKIARDQHTVDSGTDEATARPAPFRFPYAEHRTLAEVDADAFLDAISASHARMLGNAEHNPGCDDRNGLAPARSPVSFHLTEVANG